jgi:hypothetical protein
MLKFPLRLLPLATIWALASGCNVYKAKWVDLPLNDSATYRVSVKTFQDNDSVAQPFKLGVYASRRAPQIKQILSAEQCNNVEVFQDVKVLTIFYDVLALDHFSGDDQGAGLPRPLLCDNHSPICQRLRKDYAERGVPSAPVCTLR